MASDRQETAVSAVRRMARTRWIYGIGAWIAAYNPLGLEWVGKYLMAHVVFYITRDLTPMERNIRLRRAAQAAVAEVETMMGKGRAGGN